MDDGEIGGYRFRDRGLLSAALTHSSYLHEHPGEQGLEDFERLEFLGDAVVDLVIGDELYRRYPRATEGELTSKRSQLVSGAPLAQVAQRRFDVGHVIVRVLDPARSDWYAEQGLHTICAVKLGIALFEEAISKIAAP